MGETPHRVDQRRVQAILSTMFFHKASEMGCHSIVFADHVCGSVCCNRNELIKLGVPLSQICKNELCQVFSGRNGTCVDEERKLRDFAVKRKSDRTRDKMFILEESSVNGDRVVNTFFHILFV